MRRLREVALMLGLIGVGFAPKARAEGSAQTGYNQRLDTSAHSVVFKVDATAGEVINISGRPVSTQGSLYPWPAVTTSTLSARVTTPSGTVTAHPLTSGAGLLSVARLEQLSKDASGAYVLPVSGANAPLKIQAAETGTYLVEYLKTAGTTSFFTVPYDISITPNTATAASPFVPPGGRGRLHSPRWFFDAGRFTQPAATSAVYYAIAPSGTPGASYVWQMDFKGLAGYGYDILANDIGLDDPYSRSSRAYAAVPAPTSAPLYEIYVNPPRLDAVTDKPKVSFIGVGGNGMTIAGSGGTFQFESNMVGTYQIIIDLDGNGVFDASTTSADAVLNGRVVMGVNQALWNGTDVAGNTVGAGQFAARLLLNVGEFHFVADDDENCLPGLAINAIDPQSLAATPARMFWDDRPIPVYEAGIRDLNDPPAIVSSLPDGVMSSVARHGWGGTWQSNSFGNHTFIDTWVIGDQGSAPIEVTISAPDGDGDGDGVPNGSDVYPCDPDKVSSTYIPAENEYGQILFEDMWPEMGDYDFNDAVISYNYEIIANAAGQVTALRANLQAVAAGAGYHSSVSLGLPVPLSAIASVHRRLDAAAVDVPPMRADGQGVVIEAVADLKNFLGLPGQYINTLPTVGIVRPKDISILIELVTPGSLDGAAAPYDLFIARVDDPTHEIHRPMYPGTSSMNTSLFGLAADGSTANRHFVTRNGVPFALDVPVSTRYPIEMHAIDLLYPNIVTFGATGGAQAADYYASGVQASHRFDGDVFGATLSAPRVPPRIEVHASDCTRVFH
jgi:LruC domain-containing protein